MLKTHSEANLIVSYNSIFSSVFKSTRQIALAETNSSLSFSHFLLWLFCSVTVAHSKFLTLLFNLLWSLWFTVSLFSVLSIKVCAIILCIFNDFLSLLSPIRLTHKYPPFSHGTNIFFVCEFLILPKLLTSYLLKLLIGFHTSIFINWFK